MPSRLAGASVIEVEARDNASVSRVVFLVDGQPAFTDYTFPFCWQCPTPSFGEGEHIFGARAYDAAGNLTETAATGIIHNKLAEAFADALSPVKVNLFSPSWENDVWGMPCIAAQISHELGLKISRVEFLVDGALLEAICHDPPVYPPPNLAMGPFYAVSYQWNAMRVTPGPHYVEVRVEDEVGNWGRDQRRITVISPPAPVISVTRDVVPRENYFEVTLNLRNNGEYDVKDLFVGDTCRGFQSPREAFLRRGERGEFLELQPPPVVSRARTRDGSVMQISVGSLRKGETVSLRYFAVPVLNDPNVPVDYSAIGTRLEISCESDYGGYRNISEDPSVACTYLPRACLSIARHQADYLIVTCPSCFGDFTPEQHDLLAAMAALAKAKHGVLGYITADRAGAGAAAVRELICDGGSWCSQMWHTWRDGGYLLLVGEDNVVPAWNWEGVRLSDYPYFDTKGDVRPELKVGRIVGNTAWELTVPVMTALNGVYRGSEGLLVSGPEGTWEPNVRNATMGLACMTAHGLNAKLVHTEYFISEHSMFAEALRLKKGSQNSTRLKELATFLLQRLGLPRGGP